MPDLTVYRLVSHVDGVPVVDFDQVIDEEGWGERINQRLDLPEAAGLTGRLYVVEGRSDSPRWLGFLNAGFAEDVDVNNVAAPGALLIVKVVHKKEDAFFAFTFGVGRFVLKDTAFVRNFGLRVALNAIFEGDTGAEAFDPSRLRSVTARRPRANTLRLQGQASRSASIEDFDFELDRDLLNGVTGSPISDDKWGVRISGSNALHLSLPIELNALGALCHQMCNAHDGGDYKARFSWIDDVNRVDDPTLREELGEHLLAELKAEHLDDLYLALPELVEWHRVQHFVLPHSERNVKRPDLRLEDYIGRLKFKNLLPDLSLSGLQTQTIKVLDGDDHPVYHWSVWRCLAGEFTYKKTTYIMDDGDFFAVSPDFMSTLNDYISTNVPATGLKLPVAVVGQVEGDYNEFAAEAADLLNLDKKTVKAGPAATAVEVCDLLSTSRHLVHVKRKLGSSTLSHLFSQGFVSAELLLNNPLFRAGAKDRVEQAKDDRAVDAPLGGDVQFFDEAGFDASEFEVVFAIIADWKKGTLVDRLPFFSKVNLRRTVQELKNRRFKVSHARVGTKLAKK